MIKLEKERRGFFRKEELGQEEWKGERREGKGVWKEVEKRRKMQGRERDGRE